MRIRKRVVRESGIYQTSVGVSPEDSRQPMVEHDPSADIRKIAEDDERSLVAILRQKGVELQPFLNREGREIGLVAWTLDAIPLKPLKAAEARQAKDAITQEASVALTQLKFLLMSLDERDIMKVALDAYELGRLVERVRGCQMEASAARGRKTPATTKRGE
jgi:hypothetical protein